MNSKHKVREKANSVGYYYMGKISVSVLMNIRYWPQHGQGGCPDAHRFQVLAQNIGMGMGA